ncbi:bacteriocin class II with double-glycine leader peptide [Streptococcus criceti]|uniref:bacteriocin n=1 Tax=Streptococcus criceti TaxID=1333 RepID=UPI000225E238|nr:bacteriocin [Streptococcus criceti]SUN37685.1 bacteriocin class II with double-glycine leader peptide [Streptococcus criceti]
MKTQAIKKFEVINDEGLAQVKGGYFGALLAGLAQAYDGSVTLDQLNGRVIGHSSNTCSPYGNGGTPNSCIP